MASGCVASRSSDERDPLVFGRHSEHVFRNTHSIADELEWLDEEGPTSPALIDHLSKHQDDYDYCIIFSYRYRHAYHAVRAVAHKAILVPTAERDSAIGLAIFGPIFRGVRALMYNSPEERAMIQAVARNEEVASVVVGVGSEIPAATQPGRFRQKYNLREPFAVYVGRIDENKGCRELFDFFGEYLREDAGRLSLVLVGTSILPVPDHPRIRHLGFLDDADKFDAIAASELLIMPSYFESLSMVALEAWGLGRPVLVNGRCDVLRGQCVRSNAGLYLRERPGIHRVAACDRALAVVERSARQKRPAVFPRALRLAGDRAQVSRHAQKPFGIGAIPIDRTASRLVRAATGRLSAGGGGGGEDSCRTFPRTPIDRPRDRRTRLGVGISR